MPTARRRTDRGCDADASSARSPRRSASRRLALQRHARMPPPPGEDRAGCVVGLTTLLPRPKQRQVSEVAEVTQDVAGTEGRAEPGLGDAAELARDLPGDV